jgi:hypothetical protein
MKNLWDDKITVILFAFLDEALNIATIRRDNNSTGEPRKGTLNNPGCFAPEDLYSLFPYEPFFGVPISTGLPRRSLLCG